jgi:hypothetical protein
MIEAKLVRKLSGNTTIGELVGSRARRLRL